MPHPPPRLYVISDRRVAGGAAPMLDALRRVAAALPPGFLAVQIREKDLAPREVVALARAAVEALAPWDVPVLVNDRFDLAMAAGAAGVHLSSSGLDPADVRKAYDGLVAISTHRAAELSRLRPVDVDFAVFGPVFDTPSKRPFGPPQGVETLRRAVEASGVPVVALGGIHRDNAALLSGTGIAGIASISAVLCAPDPARAARLLADAALAAGHR
jgi:thiamine-phosphate pyrophosphorylase